MAESIAAKKIARRFAENATSRSIEVGLVGRPPKTREAKILAGNPGHRPLGVAPPTQRLCTLEPPKRLSAEGKRIWADLAPELDAAGLLTTRDRNAFEEYCAALADLRAARRAIGKSLARAENKYQQVSPYWTILERSRKAVLDLGARFGLTPVDRARAGGGGSVQKNEAGGLDEFLGRRNGTG